MKSEPIVDGRYQRCSDYTIIDGHRCVPYHQCGPDGYLISESDDTLAPRIFGLTDNKCPGDDKLCCKDPSYEEPVHNLVIEVNLTIEVSLESDDCSFYSSQGYQCVPYSKCSHDNKIIANNEDAVLPRSDFSILDPSQSKCAIDMDLCCLNPDFETPPAPRPPYQPRCGQRHMSGVDVNIQMFKEGEAQFGEWPHMCAIFDSGKQKIGGASLISKGIVLTAAHIVHKYNATPNSIFVRCGDWDVVNDHEPRAHQDRSVLAIEVKYLYRPPSSTHDNIALLFTEQEFDLDGHIDTICLPQPEDVFDNQVCFATGWGKDRFGGEGVYQQKLKEVSLPIVEDAECERIYNELRAKKGKKQNFKLDHSLLCAGGAGQDTCTGDGGGPLVCAHPRQPDHYVQTGIVSHGVGCNTSIPAVYVDVPNLVCWIDWAVTCKDQVNPGSPLASFFGLGSRCQLWMDEEKKELDALSLRLPRYQPVKDAYNRLEACKVDWATVGDSNIDISSWARKHSGSRPTSKCTTIGGGDPGASCAFPFIYLDLEYDGWAPCICVFYKVVAIVCP